MKKCLGCAQELPEDRFPFKHRKLGKRGPRCRPCKNAFQREWYRKNPEVQKRHVRKYGKRSQKETFRKVWGYLLENPCVDCGEKDPVVLEFDHVRGKKKASVSNLCSSGRTWEAVQEEIAKCVVRCANCHRRKTAKQRGYYRVALA